jgi:hypothetical protein
MNFNALVHAIADIHRRTQSAAARTVNIALTCRNWLIGAYIVEFEQRGEDRAAYGDRLLIKLAERLQRKDIPRSDERELRRFRQFYLTYPQIRDAVSPEFGESSFLPEKRDSASPGSELSASRVAKNACLSAARRFLWTSFFTIACSSVMFWWNSRWTTSVTNISANSTPMSVTTAPTKWQTATSRPWASFFARAKIMLLSSTPWQAWTIGSSYPSTNSNCRRPMSYSVTSRNSTVFWKQEVRHERRTIPRPQPGVQGM